MTSTTTNETSSLPMRSRVAIGLCSAVFLVGVSLAGSTFFRGRRLAEYREGIFEAQAELHARTGLTEAISWLRRQPTQPVLAFTPSGEDSMDPEVGLVREFAITDDLWGRYEVSRATDVSSERGHSGPGVVWRLRSAGFVFERDDPRRAFDRDAPGVLHRAVLEVEVARLGVRLPGSAALCVRQVSELTVGPKARVAGGGAAAGIYHAASTAKSPNIRDGEVTGATAVVGATTESHYDDSVDGVFGVSRRVLGAMADGHITHPDFVPARLRPDSLYCVEVSELVFTKTNPLQGSGILYVKGDVTIETGSESRFTGLLFVDGDLSVRSATDIRGAVVVTGRTQIRGDRNFATLHYDDDVIRALADTVGSYRMSTPVRNHQIGTPESRND